MNLCLAGTTLGSTLSLDYNWIIEPKGSKRVELAGLNDKRQITAVFCASLAGEFLPVQLIYQGKTTACLPNFCSQTIGMSHILPTIGVMKTR